MRPEHCGFGRSLESLTPPGRKAVEDFGAFLAGRVALTADQRSWVPYSDPRAAIRVCGCRWEPGGLVFVDRCDAHAVMCRVAEPWEYEIMGAR